MAEDAQKQHAAQQSKHHEPTMPSEVTSYVSPFDRFATGAEKFVSRAWFFAICVLLVVIWVPSFFIFQDIDTWQLVINTATTIITFLLVALLQNTQSRENNAVQHKLNAIAEGLGNLMTHMATDDPTERPLKKDVIELRDAVGLEQKESS
ncbi:low affinity iron permease family protein [Hamadaea sp.]|uniref:low affinity iron permease family protein n=1 Tax=Hamadaea sp. TaxID=2024425 RepID=UPI0025C3F162|nr:low affinity iron permease family protein [Hamadaea sp.]